MTHFTFVFLGQGLVSAAFCAIGLLLGHYLPWRMILGARGLDRIQAYVWGSLWVSVPTTVSAIVYGWTGPQVIGSYWLSLVLGGLFVIGSYSADDYLTTRTETRENAEISRLSRGDTGGDL